MRFMLRDVRLAFPQLWVPTAPKGGGEKAYSASFLLPPNHTQILDPTKPNKKVKTIDYLEQVVFKAVAEAKWGVKAPAYLKAMKAAGKLALRDGDTKAEYEGYEGNWFVSSRSKVRPTVFDGQRNPLTQEDGKPYSGCFVNASVEFWAQDNDFGKRINAQLRGVQFYRDGDAFAGGSQPADSDEFEEIAAPDEGEEGEEGSDDDLLG
jgi:hypothetical protein